MSDNVRLACGHLVTVADDGGEGPCACIEALYRGPCGVMESLQARVIASCLQGLSETSRRVYSARIDRYLEWTDGLYGAARLTRESVRNYLRSQELQGATPQVRNQTLAALKRFASEAAELGMLDAAEAARIGTIRSKRLDGTKAGRWLTEQQLAQLLRLPDRTTAQGRRDACLLALLIGCGLRRAEACALEAAQIRQLDGRMYLWNVRGKGGRVRTIQVPKAVEADIAQWLASVGTMRLLRSFHSDGTINGSLSTGAVRKLVQHYGSLIGVPALNPHDLRRSLARAARRRGAPLETIQHTLGHASVRTTELYTRTGEEANAGDFVQLDQIS